MILADENVDRLIIEALRNKGFAIYSIKEKHPGFSDEQIIELSKNPPRIILTSDKDFGTWVFAHNVKDISIVFLRYKFPDRMKMINLIVGLFQEHLESLKGKFTTVTVHKIRTTTLL